MHLDRTPRAAAAVLAALMVLTGCASGADQEPGTSTSARAEFNRADVTFATDMIPHHRQAVTMAELVPDRASDPQVEQLADAVRDAQDPEIETMTGWLRAWGQDVPGTSGHDMSGSMDGMASPAQLDELAALDGTAFDRAFLTLMKAHHEGAISMARTEQEDGRNTEATDLAASIESEQSAEIETIETILARL